MKVILTLSSGRKLRTNANSNDLIEIMNNLMMFDQFLINLQGDEDVLIRTDHIESIEKA